MSHLPTYQKSLHYGTPESNSLHLLAHYFTLYPRDAEKVTLSIKGSYDARTGPDGSPSGIRSSVATALEILPPHVKKIDIFQCARVDPSVPIESTVETLAQLVYEGKILGVGLSEVRPETIRRARAVYPIAAVEIELSLFTTDPVHNGILDTCCERTFCSRFSSLFTFSCRHFLPTRYPSIKLLLCNKYVPTLPKHLNTKCGLKY